MLPVENNKVDMIVLEQTSCSLHPSIAVQRRRKCGRRERQRPSSVSMHSLPRAFHINSELLIRIHHSEGGEGEREGLVSGAFFEAVLRLAGVRTLLSPHHHYFYFQCFSSNFFNTNFVIFSVFFLSAIGSRLPAFPCTS